MNVLASEQPATRSKPFIARILAAVDLTSRSLGTADYAASLAKSFGASLILVYVPPSESMYDFVYNGGYDLVDSQQRDQRHALISLTETVSRRYPFCTHSFLVGNPAVQIAEFAKEMDIDLIITASYHPSFFASLLHLDQAPKMIHEAPCPVLVFQG